MTGDDFKGLLAWMVPRWPAIAAMETPVLEAMGQELRPYRTEDVSEAVRSLFRQGWQPRADSNPAGRILWWLAEHDVRTEQTGLPGPCPHKVTGHWRGEVTCAGCGEMLRDDCGCRQCTWDPSYPPVGQTGRSSECNDGNT